MLNANRLSRHGGLVLKEFEKLLSQDAIEFKRTKSPRPASNQTSQDSLLALLFFNQPERLSSNHLENGKTYEPKQRWRENHPHVRLQQRNLLNSDKATTLGIHFSNLNVNASTDSKFKVDRHYFANQHKDISTTHVL